MGNFCCKPSTFKRKSEFNSDGSQENIVLQRLVSIKPTESEIVSNNEPSIEITNSNPNVGENERLNTNHFVSNVDSVQQSPQSIQPTEPEIASNLEPSNEIMNSNENIGENGHLNTNFSAPNIEQHTTTGDLCDILKIQKFSKSEGPCLKDKLKPDQGPNKFGKIHKNLNCLLGNGRDQVLTIPEIVEELMPRNYPEVVDFDGTGKLVTFVPEWYLTKAPKFADPARSSQLYAYSEQMANEPLCPERKKVFEDMKKFYMGGERTHRGELPEKELYHALQAYFDSKNESVAIFHGIDILKMNLDRFKVNEKDFVILNATRRCIIVVEVKKTLGAGDSIEKSIEQLTEAKEDLEAWFGTEGLEHWTYVPMIYTEKIQPDIDCYRCNQHVMEGNVKYQ